jgi:hypothetical protein
VVKVTSRGEPYPYTWRQTAERSPVLFFWERLLFLVVGRMSKARKRTSAKYSEWWFRPIEANNDLLSQRRFIERSFGKSYRKHAVREPGNQPEPFSEKCKRLFLHSWSLTRSSAGSGWAALAGSLHPVNREPDGQGSIPPRVQVFPPPA